MSPQQNWILMETLVAFAKIIFWISVASNHYQWMRPLLDNVAIYNFVRAEAFAKGYFYPWEAAPGPSILADLHYAIQSCRDNPPEDLLYLHLYVRTCSEVRGGTFYWCHLELNRQFRSHCEAQETLGGYHAAVWSSVRKEAEFLHGIYLALDMLSSENVCLYRRRQYLAFVRRSLGDELFELGYVPPVVPVHRFTRINP